MSLNVQLHTHIFCFVQTHLFECSRPEVLFQGVSWAPFYRDNPFSYDSWSIGVVVSAYPRKVGKSVVLSSVEYSNFIFIYLHLYNKALEMLLGSPNVFSVDQRTTALLTNRLKKRGSQLVRHTKSSLPRCFVSVLYLCTHNN